MANDLGLTRPDGRGSKKASMQVLCELRAIWVLGLYLIASACSAGKSEVSARIDKQDANRPITSASLEAGIAGALRGLDIDRPFAWTAGRVAAIDREGVLRMFNVRKDAAEYILTADSLLPSRSRAFERILSGGPIDFSTIVPDREAPFRIDTIRFPTSTIHINSCLYARQREVEADGGPLLSTHLRIIQVREERVVENRVMDFDPESPVQVEARDFDGDRVMEFAFVGHYVSDTLRVWKVGEDGSLRPLIFAHPAGERNPKLSNEEVTIGSDERGDFVTSMTRDYRGILTTVFRWD